MLLQTNSYIVPKEKRSEHARLMRRFKQVLGKLGCDMFEIYEQVGANWNGADTSGRYVQIMRFRDRKHQVAVQNAERNDPAAQALIAEFCDLVNFPYQQQQGFFAVGFYNSVLPSATLKAQPMEEEEGAVAPEAMEAASFAGAEAVSHPTEPSIEAAGDFGPPAEMVEGELVSEAHYPPTGIDETDHASEVEETAEIESAEPSIEAAAEETDPETALAELPAEPIDEHAELVEPAATLEGELGGLESESVQSEEIAVEEAAADEVEAVESIEHEPSAGEMVEEMPEHQARVGDEFHFGDGELAAQDNGELEAASPELVEEELMEEPVEGSEEALAEEGLEVAEHDAELHGEHAAVEHSAEPTAEVVEPEPERRSLFRRGQR